MDRLWCHSDVTHKRNTGLDNLPDDAFVSIDAFELHGVSAIFQQRPDGAHRGPDALAVRQERHVRDQERVGRRPCHGGRVQRHQRNSCGDRRSVAVHHHRRRIADENRVDLGTFDEMSGPGIVGGDYRDLASLGLESGEVTNIRHRASQTPERRRGVQSCGWTKAGVLGTCRMDQVLLEG